MTCDNECIPWVRLFLSRYWWRPPSSQLSVRALFDHRAMVLVERPYTLYGIEFVEHNTFLSVRIPEMEMATKQRRCKSCGDAPYALQWNVRRTQDGMRSSTPRLEIDVLPVASSDSACSGSAEDALVPEETELNASKSARRHRGGRRRRGPTRCFVPFVFVNHRKSPNEAFLLWNCFRQ